MTLDILPPVHEVLGLDTVESQLERFAPRYRTRLVRAVLADFRKALRSEPARYADRPTATRAIAEQVVRRAQELERAFPRRVVNGSGILIHTNLGRAPLGDGVRGIGAAGLTGYSDLEWDAASQKRGSRDARVSDLLTLVTGADAALVVNNCASALLLALGTLARGKRVIVSRSELVEIGGAFRVPEIVESSGCELVEVGTTNKTRLADYRKAARSPGCVFLKVHQSNFVQRGFVESVALADLADLARKLRLPLVHDNGSGLLTPSRLDFLQSEPSIEDNLRDGAPLVVASGDKLLGSVQAGLIVGRAPWVRAMRRNPLYRALRLDKVRLALLHQTFLRYLRSTEDEIPLLGMSARDLPTLEVRSARIRLPKPGSRWKEADWVQVRGSMGGGSNPETTFPSLALRLVHRDQTAERIRSRFAARDIPIVGYIRQGAFFLDLRTMFDEDFAEVQGALDEYA